jgi:hypothetical protein
MEAIPRKILRKMGFRADSQGIIDRYINVNGAWEGHLQQTKEFILDAFSGKRIRNLAILGSGWLLDLPIEELTGMCGQILLYDLVHPRQVQHRLQHYPNVATITTDITGGAVINAFRAVREYKRSGLKPSPEEICRVKFQPEVQADFTISLNMLSQLGIMITDYLKQSIPYSEDETERIIFLLQQSHMQLLFPGKSCLISDIRENSFDHDGHPIGSKELIKCALPSSGPAKKWDWQFDPLGEYYPDKITISTVMAFNL